MYYFTMELTLGKKVTVTDETGREHRGWLRGLSDVVATITFPRGDAWCGPRLFFRRGDGLAPHRDSELEFEVRA